MIAWISAFGGLFLLVLGGEALVRGGASIAERLRISPLIVGLVLVGFGTSTPELATSVRAALANAPEIAIGNVVGSNIANVLLILGLAALVRPIAASRLAMLRDGLVALAASIAVITLAQYGLISRIMGLVFLSLLVIYVAGTYLSERRSSSASGTMLRQEAEFAHPMGRRIWVSIAISLAGIATVVAGAALLVDGASVIARSAGISERVIGLTLVAVGTSLPELIVTVIASLRGQADIAFGNILGSNIFNIFGILGLTALIQPLPISGQTANFDVWIMGATSAAILVLAYTGLRLNRWEGATCLVLYATYVWFLFDTAATG